MLQFSTVIVAFCIVCSSVLPILASPLPSNEPSDVDLLNKLMADDMRFLPQSRSGKKDVRYRWADKTVPYVVDSAFKANELSNIKLAMDEISSKTCIKFKPRTTENDYISVKTSTTGCNSYVGRIGGKQDVNLVSACATHRGATAHELIHAIGFEHEQARTDRDDYVTIVWDNIQNQYKFAFDKYGTNIVSDFGVPYDYHSVMHYYKYAFAKDASKPTMIPKQAGVDLYYPTEVSKLDAMKINRMYGC